jgi:uncharacterized membrane protein YcaP (DUF421 family)
VIRPGAAAIPSPSSPVAAPGSEFAVARRMDWNELFGLSVSPWELVVRGSAMYLFLFILFRVVVKRRVGSIGMADILILVIVADAAQNGMAGEYRSVTEGFILVGTLVGWNMLIDWLAFRFAPLRDLLEPPPLLLIDNGRVLRRHLRIELMSENELETKLREHGVTDPREVAKAYIEPDGQVTVLKKKI